MTRSEGLSLSITRVARGFGKSLQYLTDKSMPG